MVGHVGQDETSSAASLYNITRYVLGLFFNEWLFLDIRPY